MQNLEILTAVEIRDIDRTDGDGQVRRITYEGVGRPVKTASGVQFQIPRAGMLADSYTASLPLEQAQERILGTTVEGKIVWVESTNPKAESFEGENALPLSNPQTGVALTSGGKQIYGTWLLTFDPTKEGNKMSRDIPKLKDLDDEPEATAETPTVEETPSEEEVAVEEAE